MAQSRDPQVRLETGHAAIRVGEIQVRLGQDPAAETAARRAVTVLDPIVVLHPAEPGYRHALARATFPARFGGPQIGTQRRG